MLSVAGCLLVGWGLLVLLLGQWGTTRLMNANPCEMTYSRPVLNPVHVSSAAKGFSLLEQAEAEGGRPRKPVLFVPGHSGSALQMRSLASHMHNDGRYHFFGLDFNGSQSAVHGQHVLAQATFLNDALRAIRDVDPLHYDDILVVAHSMGGIVARAAMTLDNHPACIVSNLILLSSPNTRPSVSLDASLLDLYVSVNRAWKHSLYNETPNCQVSAAATADGLSPRADWKCPPCTARTRLVSITGGDIDYFVPAPLTTLRAMEPTPMNRSAVDPRPLPLVSALKPKGGFVNCFFRFVKNTAFGAYRLVFWNGTESSCNGEACAVDEVPQIIPEAVVDGRLERYSPRNRQLLEMTQDAWDMDMLPHIQPQHISLRSSMLRGVGFQVDHLAILWCRQALSVVHSVMDQLSDLPSTHDGGRGKQFHRVTLPLLVPTVGSVAEDVPLWINVTEDPGSVSYFLKGVVKRKFLTLPPASTVSNVSDDGAGGAPQLIPPIAAIMRRTAAHAMWKQGAKAERQEMVDLFDASASGGPKETDIAAAVVSGFRLGWVVVSSLVFVTQRLQTIGLVYTLICCMSLAVPILERLSLDPSVTRSNIHDSTGKRPVLPDWFRVASPSVHLLSGFWYRVIAATMGEVLLGTVCEFLCEGLPFGKLLGLPRSSRALLNVVAVSAVVVSVVCHSELAGQVEIISVAGPLLEWTASYGLAILLWVLVGILLTMGRQLASLVCAPVLLIKNLLRKTKEEVSDVEAIRKARVAAAAAAASGVQRASVWSYLSGVNNSHVATIHRPSAVYLTMLAISPLLPIALVFGLSASSIGESPAPVLMKGLCAANVALYGFAVIAWLVTALVPATSARSPLWFRGGSATARKVPAFSADFALTMAAALSWPILVLAYPSFEFSLTMLFEDIVPLKVVSVWLHSYGFSVLSDVLAAQHHRIATMHANAMLVSGVTGLFGPGMMYVSATLYLTVVFLVITRSEPIFDHIRPVAWLCELQASGSSVIKAINVRVSTNPAKKKRSSEVKSTSIFEDGGGKKKKKGKSGHIPANGKCCHEDGGKYAIFECSTEYADDVSLVGDGSVLLGSVYYVVNCRCFQDKMLTKGRVEWCEWCRCPKCGGTENRTGGTEDNGSWLSRFIQVPDVNADLGLLLGLIGGVVWTVMYVNDYLFRMLHCLGGYVGAIVLHRVIVFFGY